MLGWSITIDEKERLAEELRPLHKEWLRRLKNNWSRRKRQWPYSISVPAMRQKV